LKEVPAVYGITRPAQTWNPIKINFQHLWLLIQDAWRAPHWKDKFRIWFMPTGWRPANFEEKYPVLKINDVYHFEKYNPYMSKTRQYWAVLQLFIILGFVSFMFANIAAVGLPNLFLYGLFIFISIYSLSELMDGNQNAVHWEGIRFLFAFSLLFYFQSWLGLFFNSSILLFILLSYFIISFVISFYFVKTEIAGNNRIQFSK